MPEYSIYLNAGLGGGCHWTKIYWAKDEADAIKQFREDDPKRWEGLVEDGLEKKVYAYKERSLWG